MKGVFLETLFWTAFFSKLFKTAFFLYNMGIFNSSISQANAVFTAINPIISKIFIGLIILLIGFILGRILGTVVKRLFQMIELDQTAYRIFRANLKIERFISGLASFVIYFLAVIAALSQVGLLSIIAQGLSYIIVIVVLLSIILSLRNIIPNFAAGIFLKRKLGLRPGTKIIMGNISGTIKKANSVYLQVITEEEDILLIPFSCLLQEKTTIKKESLQNKNTH